MGVPITIGVTGHRDLVSEDEPGLRRAVASVLSQYRSDYPSSKIRLISALADGADRLAADVALETGCELVSALPFPRSEYEKDFDESSCDEFRRLLSRSSAVIELPKKDGPRASGYEAVGWYIVSNSDALLALWDGRNNHKAGGTAAVVSAALGDSGPTTLPDAEDTLPVHYVGTRRLSAGATEAGFEALSPLLVSELWATESTEPVTRALDFYQAKLAAIDTFNRDAAELAMAEFGAAEALVSRPTDSDVPPDTPPAVSERRTKRTRPRRRNSTKLRQSLDYLLPPNVRAELPQELSPLLETYAAADALATRNQRVTFRLLRLLLFFGVVTFFWVGFFDEIYGNPMVLLLVPVCFALAAAIYRRGSTRKNEDKFYDYRALAEGLRIEIFFRIVGIRSGASSIYSRKFKGMIGWIISGIRAVGLEAATERVAGRGDRRGLDLALEHWVRDQRTYFETSTSRRTRSARRQNRRSFAFFAAGMGFVALLFAAAALQKWWLPDLPYLEPAAHLLLLLIDTSFAVGAAFSGYAEKRQFESEGKQFRRMAGLFRRGEAAIERAADGSTDSEEKVRAILYELGREVLDENGDWLLFNRSSPIELPT